MELRAIPTWDKYYLDICKVVACRSKDPNTQIGCVIVGPNHEIRTTGYNSFPTRHSRRCARTAGAAR
jgi:deoxycytidylate deaminase